MAVFQKDEVLSDNTKAQYCMQCEKCVHWGNNQDDYRSNRFNKACCDEFPHPTKKPEYVISNTGECPYRRER